MTDLDAGLCPGLLSVTLTETVYVPGVPGAVHVTEPHPVVEDRLPPVAVQEQVKGLFSGSEATTVTVEVPPAATFSGLAVRLVMVGGWFPADTTILTDLDTGLCPGLLSVTLTETVYVPRVPGAVQVFEAHPVAEDRLPPVAVQEQVKGSFSGSEATSVTVEVPPAAMFSGLAVRLVMMGG